MVLFLSVIGEKKCEINLKKKKKKKEGAFSLFLVVRFLEKMITKCFGGKEKE